MNLDRQEFRTTCTREQVISDVGLMLMAPASNDKLQALVARFGRR